MKASRWVIFGAASHHVCSAPASSLSSTCSLGRNPYCCSRHSRHVKSPQSTEEKQERREARPSWFITGGSVTSSATEMDCRRRWWRSRKRRAALQAELAAKESAVDCRSLRKQVARKQVLVLQGMLRRLKRWLGFIVDITTLKRFRLLREARQVRLGSVFDS